ncbi:MAG: hypothetical protein JW807_11895 [Spirochaetes bacterium]|nr:hypothetical protein [Spirochaetota bacterium]
MKTTFIIIQQTESPPYYDIIIDRGDSASSFRIAQFDMLALLDGTEVLSQEVRSPPELSERGVPVTCDHGAFRQFDEGSCFIERWQPPVMILQLSGRRFLGTLHLLEVGDGYSMRYIRNRSAKPRLT